MTDSLPERKEAFINTWDLPLLSRKVPIAAAVAVMMGYAHLQLATKN